MTFEQEDALYQFLEVTVEPFTLDEVTAHIRSTGVKRQGRLAMEVERHLNICKLAFPVGLHKWISVRGCFEKSRFLIQPSRLELAGGILIPGHRCLPFANSDVSPSNYVFHWGKKTVPTIMIDGEPEEFYPYYSVFGEEYAPQYVAGDNPKNEKAYNEQEEEPAQVSIKVLDMRNIYRETGFVPGDSLEATVLDWRKCVFGLKKIDKDTWSEKDLRAWEQAAEEGFKSSFIYLGPGVSTEEQIAYAYFYGGKRMRDTPAYALEDFLFERTEIIDSVTYGVETRFWFAGKDIPDSPELMSQRISDRTPIEEILHTNNIPITEYVIQAYVMDMLFRRESKMQDVAMRIVPPPISQKFETREWNILLEYIAEIYDEYSQNYSIFNDQELGPLRQRAAELHTAVIKYAANLRHDTLNSAYLPHHTFIVLSQIQNHSANILDELGFDALITENELGAMENALEGMEETFDNMKYMITEAMENFRKNSIVIVQNTDEDMRLLQISIGGTEVWRRLLVPESFSLEELHYLIQRVFDWEDNMDHRFSLKNSPLSLEKTEEGTFIVEGLPNNLTLDVFIKNMVLDFVYEYGTWTIKALILSPGRGNIACVAGEKAAPKQNINGPVRFKRDLALLSSGIAEQRKAAREELGEDFDPDYFDEYEVNQRLKDLA